MNYITRTLNGIPLYYDGEKFQTEQSKGQHYETEEARQVIKANDLQFAEITPIGHSDVYDLLTKPHRA